MNSTIRWAPGLPPLDEQLPLVLSCFRLMLPDGALFTEDRVPIPVVIAADLRAIADWLPLNGQQHCRRRSWPAKCQSPAGFRPSKTPRTAGLHTHS